MTWEYQYLNALQQILDEGIESEDRTGVGTLSVFGDINLKINLKEGFPAVTTKKLAWKAMVSENLWFIEGSDNERRLAEILHGTRDPAKKTIWTENAQAPYWKPNARSEGDLGRVYGVQWRDWRTIGKNGEIISTDQLQRLLDGMKNNPYNRRHLLLNYNPGETASDLMALPACHLLSQYYVRNNTLSCKVYIRSNDMFLGLPFNIAGYAFLTHLFAHLCGYEVGYLHITEGDAHIYSNHIDQVKELLTRTPMSVPQIEISKRVTSINDLRMDDFKLLNYNSHPALLAPMAV